jgi:4-hydroxy-3-methylbut-2-enyl diphosphate reductase
LAESALRDFDEIYVTGDLVHNSVVMNRLRGLGLRIIDENDLPSRSTVLVQAHGAPVDLVDRLKKLNNRIIDGTCPIVKKSFGITLEANRKGFKSLVFGKRAHPEMVALKSLAPEAQIFENSEQLNSILSDMKKESRGSFALTAQTTKPLSAFSQFASEISSSLFMFQSVIVYNTICDATISRENEIRDRACAADCVIIIGGEKSSNTRKLYEIAKKKNENSFLVHGIDDVKKIRDKIYQFNNVVLGSGTSTPMLQVEEVQNYISRGM